MTQVNSVTSSSNRILDIEGVINFRDIGGYQTQTGRQVRWGKVFRSAQLDRPTDKGPGETMSLLMLNIRVKPCR